MEILEKDYKDFKLADTVLLKLTKNWENSIKSDTDHNRRERYVRNFRPDDLRAQGLLKQDETFIALKIVDSNIRIEQPQYIAYLTQSRRAAVFTSPTNDTIAGLEQLEIDFTNRARYNAWEKPFLRVVDGCQMHGWDSIEVVFDPGMPGNFAIEHVGRDNLCFSKDAEELEAQEIIARKFSLTALQLREFVKNYNFNSTEVEKLITADKTKTSRDAEEYDIISIVYKVFFKQDDFVWVGWWAEGLNDWLKAPEKLYLGMHDILQQKVEVGAVDMFQQPVLDYPPMYEKSYPFYLLPYIESENPVITKLVGRLFLDYPVQEACSTIISAFVNGCTRASNVYGAPAVENLQNPRNEPPKQTNVVLKNGAIYDQPMNFTHMPWPDRVAVFGIDYLIRQNKQEGSQINYAALTRPDTEKTATELKLATKEAEKLSTVNVTLLSIFIRGVYTRCWIIYQNRVLQGKIDIKPTLLPLFGEIDEASGQVLAVANYVIKSAGDVDVVQRAEKLVRQMQFWPVVSKTALAMEFLKDIIRNAFPEDAERYCGILDEAKMQGEEYLKALVGKLASLLKEAIITPEGQIRPEFAQYAPQLQQLNAEVNAVLAQQPSGETND